MCLQNNSLHRAKRECAPRANLPLQCGLNPTMLQSLEITPKSCLCMMGMEIQFNDLLITAKYPLQNLLSNLSLYPCALMEHSPTELLPRQGLHCFACSELPAVGKHSHAVEHSLGQVFPDTAASSSILSHWCVQEMDTCPKYFCFRIKLSRKARSEDVK